MKHPQINYNQRQKAMIKQKSKVQAESDKQS